jgi:Ras-related protein Rab-2A
MVSDYDYIFKLILLGDSGVGKSCMLYRYINDKFLAQHDVTIGVEFGTKLVSIEDTKIKLQLWDSGGQEAYRSITRSYYRDAAGIVLCYDITNYKSFDDIVGWLSDINELCNNPSIILVGTKTDLESRRVVSFEDGKRIANKYKLNFMEISSKTDESSPAFTKLSEMIHKRLKEANFDIKNLNCSGVRQINNSIINLSYTTITDKQNCYC